MRALLCALWRDERGSMLVTEWVFVATILVLGIMPAALSIRHRIQQTIAQVGQAAELDTVSFSDREPTN